MFFVLVVNGTMLKFTTQMSSVPSSDMLSKLIESFLSVVDLFLDLRPQCCTYLFAK